jgi:hypothetical protein
MSDFKIPMPKAKAKAGNAHIVLAVKFENGGRVEYIGQVSKNVALAAIDATVTPKRK